jgi:hypothetical protein
MRTLLSLSVMTLALVMPLGLVGCGQAKPTVDAGPDTSCGFDCAAQAKFGLLVNRCFEYSDNPVAKQDPPALGMWVRPLRTLEGGLQVLPVEYRQNGQIKMVDNFTITNGELLLVRREFSGSGQSVTYKKGDALSGVKWLGVDSVAGENYNTTADAFLVNQAGVGATTSTAFRMTTAAATTSELRTLVDTYTAGMKLLPGESPDHGSDTRRVFVPDVGFVVLASSFSLLPGTSLPLTVQKIRDPGTPDGGSDDCSLGRP